MGKKVVRARSFWASWASGGNTLGEGQAMGGRRHSSAQWVVTLCYAHLLTLIRKPYVYTLGARWFESFMFTLGTKWYYAEPPRVLAVRRAYMGGDPRVVYTRYPIAKGLFAVRHRSTAVVLIVPPPPSSRVGNPPSCLGVYSFL